MHVPLNAPTAASDHSRFVQRIRRRYAGQLALLPAGEPVRASMQAAYDALQPLEADAGVRLRILRQLVLERLVVLDCDVTPTLPTSCGSLPPGGALRLRAGEAGPAAPAGAKQPRATVPLATAGVPLAVVTRAMTELAELALDIAICESRPPLDALYGPPQAPASEGAPAGRAQLWVIGMGKLGARELNVSSDIDLIYVYDHDGETAGREDGRGVVSNHEYFGQQVKAIHTLIGDTTEHGFVFRVDLALRPNG
ncbi:MAG: glutamine-synthetase adenylyltransferase, partial [Polaromonas sp.]|nr:glutamine-synthetase adenylyltransferase [Polaromonas sp.]